jgi:hypothetical protein
MVQLIQKRYVDEKFDYYILWYFIALKDLP